MYYLKFAKKISTIPVSGWLLGGFAAVLLEYFFGQELAYFLYLPKIPVLFGTLVILKSPELIPGVLGYDLLIYFLPTLLVAWFSRSLTNRVAIFLEKLPTWLAVVSHLFAFYGILHLWSGINDYRMLVVKLTLIAVLIQKTRLP